LGGSPLSPSSGYTGMFPSNLLRYIRFCMGASERGAKAASRAGDEFERRLVIVLAHVLYLSDEPAVETIELPQDAFGLVKDLLEVCDRQRRRLL